VYGVLGRLYAPDLYLTQGADEGYLYYFTHPGGGRRSTVQVARLHVRDGWLRCDRDEPFDYRPDPAKAPAFRGGGVV
jgi:hypothetical protein